VEQLQELQRIFNMKNEELEQVKEALKIMTARCEEAENQLREAFDFTGTPIHILVRKKAEA